MSPEFIHVIIVYTVILSGAVFLNKNVRGKLIQLLSNRIFLVNLSIIVPFVIYTLQQDTKNDPKKERQKQATIQALIGFIIAVFGSIDVVGAPFFLIWITSYFLGA